MTPTPLNLRDLFGDRCRMGHDPAAETYAERNDPWMQTLPCRNGVIYPYGANRLAVECKGSTATKILEDMPGIAVHQQGNTEWTLLFDLALFDAVAAIVKPRKRRLLSQEQIAANTERLEAYRFKNGTQPTARKTLKDASKPPKWPAKPPKGIRGQENARAAGSGISRKASHVGCKQSGEAKVKPGSKDRQAASSASSDRQTAS